jgi:hypothetical protein
VAFYYYYHKKTTDFLSIVIKAQEPYGKIWYRKTNACKPLIKKKKKKDKLDQAINF